MIGLTKLRSLAWLVALLPQVAVLGLGRGLVLCVAPSGHVQVEVSGGSCCADPSSPAPVGVEECVQPPDDPDCGPCSDLGIPVDRRPARSSDVRGSEFTANAATVVAVACRPAVEATVRAGWGERGQAPPHLVHLRSVVLRC